MQYATISMLFLGNSSPSLVQMQDSAIDLCRMTGEMQVIYCKDPDALAWQVYCKVKPNPRKGGHPVIEYAGGEAA